MSVFCATDVGAQDGTVSGLYVVEVEKVHEVDAFVNAVWGVQFLFAKKISDAVVPLRAAKFSSLSDTEISTRDHLALINPKFFDPDVKGVYTYLPTGFTVYPTGESYATEISVKTLKDSLEKSLKESLCADKDPAVEKEHLCDPQKNFLDEEWYIAVGSPGARSIASSKVREQWRKDSADWNHQAWIPSAQWRKP